MKKEYAFPDSMEGRHLRSIRRQLGMTQVEFALYAGVSKKTVENWESEGSVVHGPVITLARILIERPELVEYFQFPERTSPLRLCYYFRNELCTIIDVDEIDYVEFLKSRCFPETRDKMKLELKKLGIPFYDPMLIIEKTQGRMAEDEFSIRIERKNA